MSKSEVLEATVTRSGNEQQMRPELVLTRRTVLPAKVTIKGPQTITPRPVK